VPTARQYLKRKLAEWAGDQQELLILTDESPVEKASWNHSQAGATLVRYVYSDES
jgi:hypothetical protein